VRTSSLSVTVGAIPQCVVLPPFLDIFRPMRVRFRRFFHGQRLVSMQASPRYFLRTSPPPAINFLWFLCSLFLVSCQPEQLPPFSSTQRDPMSLLGLLCGWRFSSSRLPLNTLHFFFDNQFLLLIAHPLSISIYVDTASVPPNHPPLGIFMTVFPRRGRILGDAPPHLFHSLNFSPRTLMHCLFCVFWWKCPLPARCLRWITARDLNPFNAHKGKLFFFNIFYGSMVRYFPLTKANFS